MRCRVNMKNIMFRDIVIVMVCIFSWCGCFSVVYFS